MADRLKDKQFLVVDSMQHRYLKAVQIANYGRWSSLEQKAVRRFYSVENKRLIWYPQYVQTVVEMCTAS